MLQLTALMDDTPPKNKTLFAEHGLSYYMEYNGFRLLFDCGPTAHAQENARRLGIGLDGLDGVILSHSHYDHAAGYRDLVEAGLGSHLLYTGPQFFEPKYARKGVAFANLSCGFDAGFLQLHHIQHRVVEDAVEIHPGIWLFSGFPRLHSFETIPERFVRRQADQFIPDDFADEVCLTLEVEGGLAVLVGCSHPGILNILTHIEKTLDKPIRAVFGGTHLVEADERRIAATIARLQEMGLEILGFSHCSGEAAQQFLASRPEIQSCHLCSGDCIFLN